MKPIAIHGISLIPMTGEHKVRPYGLVDGMARIRITINVHHAIQYDH